MSESTLPRTAAIADPRYRRPDRFTAVRSGTLVLGLLMTLGLIGAHVEYYRYAGALWRDEINSVNIAALPSLSEVFAKVPYDSFPAAWLPILHGWMAMGLGASDDGLRRLGLLIGIATLAVMWWSGRRLGVEAPLVMLLLLGMSPTTIIYGDEVRGYGLSILALVWCGGAIWSFVARPRASSFLLAQLASVVAVQTHFGNCFLLLALCAGAGAVCLRRHSPRVLFATLALGAVAAGSMLIDLHALTYSHSLWPILQETFSFNYLLDVFLHALAPSVPALSVLWGAAAILAVVGFALAWRPAAGAELDADRAVFGAVVLATGLISFYVGVKYVARLRTEYWYYLPLMALIAMTGELGIDLLGRRVRLGSALRIGVIALGAALSAVDLHAAVQIRMTDLDAVAAVLERDAKPDDLIVVTPWYCGISFARYYHGAAPWITLPDFAEHRLHLHLLVAEKMTRGDAGVAAELERVDQTLRHGGRVWLVGMPLMPRAGEPPPVLPPAPAGNDGWQIGPYLEGWQLQLGARLRDHGRAFWHVPLPDNGAVNVHEDLPLLLVEGDAAAHAGAD